MKAGYRSARHCFYCGVRITRSNRTIDHVVPLSKNGDHAKANRVLACRPCNGRKADMSLEEFRAKLEKERERKVVFWGEGSC